MKFKVDRGLLPVKAHFFFFFAALGPLLPQMNVFGRQLGVSAGVMGLVTAVLPLLWAVAKPLFGYAVDYFTNQRKLIFMLLIAVMTGSYCGLWFLPLPTEPSMKKSYTLNDSLTLKSYESDSKSDIDKYKCHWDCSDEPKFEIYISNAAVIDTLYVDSQNISCSLYHMDTLSEKERQCSPRLNCNLVCLRSFNMTDSLNYVPKNITKGEVETDGEVNLQVKKKVLVRSTEEEESASFYSSAPFWWFVVLMCVGTVAFNVANCIGDAVCFDVLGPDRGSRYGPQRAWGTVGYGVTALLGGWLVDRASPPGYKDFTPAFVLALGFTVADLVSCRALKLPSLSGPAGSGRALREVLRLPRVLVFIVFAVVAGTFDSFIIYYMFWFLEELADQTGHQANIKLIEGVVVAGQSFVGELVFFFLSGKILTRFGFGKTLSFSLLCYAARLAAISAITDPWQLVVVESIMQGPTYALCYSCIVGYAAHVAPAGRSATVQGVVAGMDDGVGFAVGSLLGGQLYCRLGARAAFRAMAGAAAAAALAHALLHNYISCRAGAAEVKQIQEMTSQEAEKMLHDDHRVVYRDTTLPIHGEEREKVDGLT